MDGTGSAMGFDVKGRRTVTIFCNILFLLHYSHGIVLHVIHYLVKKRRTRYRRLTLSCFKQKSGLWAYFPTYNCFQEQQIPFKVPCFRELNGLDPWMAVDKTASLLISVSAYVSVCLCAWVSPCLHVCLSVSQSNLLFSCLSDCRCFSACLLSIRSSIHLPLCVLSIIPSHFTLTLMHSIPVFL